MSISLLLIYYIILSATETLGERELLSPLLAAWLPNLLFISFGSYLFHKTAAEEKIALFEYLPNFCTWLGRLAKRWQRR